MPPRPRNEELLGPREELPVMVIPTDNKVSISQSSNYGHDHNLGDPRPRSLATLKYSLGTYLLATFPYKFFFENLPTHAPRPASSEKGYQIAWQYFILFQRCWLVYKLGFRKPR